MTVTTKVCGKCKQIKPFEQFYRLEQAEDGRKSPCKKCRLAYQKERHKRNYKKKERKIVEGKKVKSAYERYLCSKNHATQVRIENYKKAYGITIADYDEIIMRQGNKCAICGRHQKDFKYRLAVDHCHKTGVIRGLLCQKCNLMLAGIENTEFMSKAQAYLLRSRIRINAG